MSLRKPLPSRDTILRFVDYKPDSGSITWKPRGEAEFVGSTERVRRWAASVWNKKYAGKPAGDSARVVCINISGERYAVSRLVWKILHNEEPEEVSFLNGDTGDFRSFNLKASAAIYSGKRQTIYKNSGTGIRGVTWDKKRNSWKAGIRVSGKLIYLGNFQTPERAASARRAAESKYGFSA